MAVRGGGAPTPLGPQLTLKSPSLPFAAPFLVEAPGMDCFSLALLVVTLEVIPSSGVFMQKPQPWAVTPVSSVICQCMVSH